jgi:hypothetical protein
MNNFVAVLFDMVKCFECGVYFFPGDLNPHKCKNKEPQVVEDLSVILAPLTTILNKQHKGTK